MTAKRALYLRILVSAFTAENQAHKYAMSEGHGILGIKGKEGGIRNEDFD